MADKKISALTAATTPLAGTEVLPIVQGGATVKVSVDNLTTGKNVTVGSLTDAGNLTFTGTGNRITGDFTSSGGFANRVAFQTSTANSSTNIEVIPNGTSVSSAINLESDPALTNGTFFQVAINGGVDARMASNIRGTGTYLPMTFYTGGSEQVRIDTSGNVGIGTSSPNASAILDVQSTTKGVRMPNMTTTQKNAIASPAAGLMVFDITLSKLCVYSGLAWETVTSI